MEYLNISDWDKWQTYRKDRGQPPWIKIHRRIMRNPKWVMMSDSDRGQLVAIWLLAADHDGVIPASPELIQQLCYMKKKPNISKFIELGFIDANVTPERRQGDAPEKIREDKNREEKKEVEYPEWLDGFLWKEYKIYRTAIKSPLTPFAEQLSLTALKEQMDAGYKQADIINATIQSGKWKSFYPVKNKQIEKTYPVSDFGDDLFLKQAFEFLGPGYTQADFDNHCLAFGCNPNDIRVKIKDIRG